MICRVLQQKIGQMRSPVFYLSNGNMIKMQDEWIFCLKCVKYIHNKYRKYMILWFLDKNSTKASIQWKICPKSLNHKENAHKVESIYIIWTNIPLRTQYSGNFVYRKPGDVPGKGVELFNRREITHKYEIYTSHRQKFH